MATGTMMQQDGLEVRELAAHLWRSRWWMLLAVVVCGAGFAAAAFLMTPQYRSTTVLIPAGAGGGGMGGLSSALSQMGGLASLAGITVGSQDAETEEALAVLRSRQFTEAFIVEMNLMPKLYEKDWDPGAAQWRVPQEDQPTAAEAYKYFNEKIRAIDQDTKTGLITLRIDWRDRIEATQWANELVSRINGEMRARAIAKTDASVGFLHSELEKTSDLGTREAINRLIEAQVKQRMLANVTKEYAFRVVDIAMAPDAKDVVRPRKWLMIAMGVFLGFLVGIVWVVLFRPFGRPASI